MQRFSLDSVFFVHLKFTVTHLPRSNILSMNFNFRPTVFDTIADSANLPGWKTSAIRIAMTADTNDVDAK